MATSTELVTSTVVTAGDIEAVFTTPPHSSPLTFVLTAWQIAGQIAMRGHRLKDAALARQRLNSIQEQVDALLAAEVDAGRLVSAVGYQARALGTHHLAIDGATTYYAWASSAQTWQASGPGQRALAQLAESALRAERVERMRQVGLRAEAQLGGYVDDVSAHPDGKHVLLKVTPGQVATLAAAVAVLSSQVGQG